MALRQNRGKQGKLHLLSSHFESLTFKKSVKNFNGILIFTIPLNLVVFFLVLFSLSKWQSVNRLHADRVCLVLCHVSDWALNVGEI